MPITADNLNAVVTCILDDLGRARALAMERKQREAKAAYSAALKQFSARRSALFNHPQMQALSQSFGDTVQDLNILEHEERRRTA